MTNMTRIPVIRNKEYQLNGLKSYVFALNKYNITPTQPSIYHRPHGPGNFLMKEKADGTHGLVEATDQQNDSFYTCPVQIGSPPQTVNLDFDSGSADLWVWSTKLPHRSQGAEQTDEIAIFDPKQSNSFKNVNGSTWQIQYGDGSAASGTVGTDTVQIGDIVIHDQAVELASQVSSEFQNGSSSGLLGLAWGNINTVKPEAVKTPVDNMIAQKDLPDGSALWSVYLGSVKDVNGPDHGKSWYTFGHYDESVIQASGQQINWTSIDNSQGFWMFASDSALINGQTIQLSGNKAIADTGTTLMLVSDQLCKAIYGQIDGAKYDRQQGGWLIPTSNVNQRPLVQVKVGNANINIGKELLAWQDVGNGLAFGAIQSRGTLDFDIFGDTFLICCYAVFDVGNQRFGVVQRPGLSPAGQ